ncbi:hypothetical protein HG537_0H04450 [Torulaspora globosa]|uniref:Mog1p/PsbP-like protein n=1 Tax=Torulaspora globosa TaxID=48254 RepID=A0A7H9I1J5_9SACH|nr:hypothetical protein HG537_0H04450 [Torulaspora sp. CBS 2947]
MGAVTGLYGGAITTYLPEGFLDASLLREVPDTQEVYVNSRGEHERYDDGLGKNESVVVDLLERVDADDDVEALRVHVMEIASFDRGSDVKFTRLEQLAENQQACVVVERVNKWGKQELNETVVLCVGLIRLADVATDVVITVHVPWSNESFDGHELPAPIEAAYKLLLTMVTEFKVVDKSLFV